MQLIVKASDADKALRSVHAPGSPILPDQRAEAAALLTPETFARVKALLAAVDHDDASATPERIAAAFDRAAAISPEGGVALYSLGDPALLARLTREVVEALAAAGLIAAHTRVVEVGCGIGRFLVALAPRVALAIGLDISAGMIAEAGRRCARLPNVLAARSGGRDLACIADASADLVLFADSFPYLVQAGEGLAERHFDEARRVLRRPGGRLLILNYSYRGDPARDRAEAEALARAHGLSPLPFAMPPSGWDAIPYLFSA